MENRMESLRQNWFVIQQLIKRDKQRSLSSTFMGELWEIINPLINMIVMVLVFGKMFGGNDFNQFPLYVLTGTTLYGLFTSGTTMCLQALMGNKNFLIKTQLNRNVYVIQKILLAFRIFPDDLCICNRFVPDFTECDMAFIYSRCFSDADYDAGDWKNTCGDQCDICGYYIFLQDIYAFSHVWISNFLSDRLSPAMQKIMTIVNPLYTVIAIARECIMERIFPDWKLWVIVSVYAGGCYLVGSVYFNRKIEDIVAKM